MLGIGGVQNGPPMLPASAARGFCHSAPATRAARRTDHTDASVQMFPDVRSGNICPA